MDAAVRSANGKADESSRKENLALAYQELFTAIVRIQANRQQIGNAEMFRRRMNAALADIARHAGGNEFAPTEVQDAEFAVVAFLDETILSSDDPNRGEWAKKTLQSERFATSRAGEEFFERLEKLRARRDSPTLADLLEIYYLCLLLGFEGRYAGANRSELALHMDQMRERIARIHGAQGPLSPSIDPAPEALPAPRSASLMGPARLAALVIAAVVLLSFVGFKIQLTRMQSEAVTAIHGAAVGR